MCDGAPQADGLSRSASSQQAVSPVPASIPSADEIKAAWDVLQRAMSDPEYAWSWHCNLTMPIYDAIVLPIDDANVAAANIMAVLFGHDITADERFGYQKSGAQAYFEIRVAAEREEDAAQAIEARRAETQSGSVHESAVPEGCAKEQLP